MFSGVQKGCIESKGANIVNSTLAELILRLYQQECSQVLSLQKIEKLKHNKWNTRKYKIVRDPGIA